MPDPQQALWYPYAQMKTMRPPLAVESAEGVHLHLEDGRTLIDGISSWWCVIHGYCHPELNRAATAQLESLSHVMLGGLTHGTTARLAERLVEITPAGLNHVFFGDSGSVGVEIAIKMAIQFWQNRGKTTKTRLLALEKAYHGDTCGAMSVCDPEEGMHALFTGLLPQQVFLPAPRGGFDAPQSVVDEDLARLDAVLREQSDEIAGMIVEPLVQAAGGFNFYSPAYLQGARALCDRHDILLIFDEVATGFGRTGALFAAGKAEVVPDIMVLGKGLTAGYLSHSATLATDRVYGAFYDDDPQKCLMHGPTFMGNPLACAVALKSIEIFERENYLDKIARIEAILRDEILPIRSGRVKDTRVLGAIGVVEAHDAASVRDLQAFAADRGVWLRPFGTYAYTMPPYVIGEEELRQVCAVMREWFTD